MCIGVNLSNKSVSYEIFFFFFFNDTATTEIYTLSLHDALPISVLIHPCCAMTCTVPVLPAMSRPVTRALPPVPQDRKSTRLNSSHSQISYAVFCLKKKTKDIIENHVGDLKSIDLIQQRSTICHT